MMMTGTLFAALVLSLAAEAGLSEERARNEEAFAFHGGRLRREAQGRWVAIARGEVFGPEETMDAASRAADEKFPDAPHRFVYRPGVDDELLEFAQSPWIDRPGEPGNHLQIGTRWLADRGVDLVMSSDVYVDFRGKKAKYANTAKAPFVVRAADGRGEGRRREFVLSTLMERSISITEECASALGLDRYAVPGGARLRGTESAPPPYRKVRVRLALPDVGFEGEAIAAVVPGKKKNLAR